MRNANKELIAPIPQTNYYSHVLGKKQYELSNHLGNVLTVITDKKIPVENINITCEVEYFIVEILSATDYSPFGVTLKEREFTSEKYRYGVQGKEKDDEIKGEGNSYDFGARFFDNRLGRWLSIDPHFSSYVVLSPYSYCANSQIINIDYNGKDIEPTVLIGYDWEQKYLPVVPYSAGGKYQHYWGVTTFSGIGVTLGDKGELVSIDAKIAIRVNAIFSPNHIYNQAFVAIYGPGVVDEFRGNVVTHEKMHSDQIKEVLNSAVFEYSFRLGPASPEIKLKGTTEQIIKEAHSSIRKDYLFSFGLVPENATEEEVQAALDKMTPEEIKEMNSVVKEDLGHILGDLRTMVDKEVLNKYGGADKVEEDAQKRTEHNEKEWENKMVKVPYSKNQAKRLIKNPKKAKKNE
jgi:RHS repeat-associated protein